MALPYNLKLSKAGMIIFFSWIILPLLLLGCKKAVEDSYGKTYGINIAGSSEQKVNTGAAELRNYSMQNISKELEGTMEGNLVVLVMSLNKSNLKAYSVIPKDIKFYRKPKNADVYFFQLLDASERGLFVSGIPGLEYSYDPGLDGKLVIP